MLKCDEQASETSCLNKAYADEMLFVVLARDPAGPETVRFWCAERIRLKLNTPFDKKITNALAVAERMEKDREQIRKRADEDKAEQEAREYTSPD